MREISLINGILSLILERQRTPDPLEGVVRIAITDGTGLDLLPGKYRDCKTLSRKLDRVHFCLFSAGVEDNGGWSVRDVQSRTD